MIINFLLGAIILTVLIQGISNRNVDFRAVALMSLCILVVHFCVTMALVAMLGIYGIVGAAIMIIPITMFAIHGFFAIDLPRSAGIAVAWIIVQLFIQYYLSLLFYGPQPAA